MFGFGKGKVEIQLDKYNFSPGEYVKGKVIVKLNKVVKAKAVYVKIIGVKATSRFSGSGISMNKTINKDYVFNFRQPLDGAKEYSREKSYNFEIKIPPNVLTSPQFGTGVLGSLIKSAQALSGVNTLVKWYVVAGLDIPGGFDVSKKIQINVG